MTAPGPHRRILRLAVPAFVTLVAEPLFLLADTAVVGHLGTTALAGLGVASTVLLTAVNLCVFLAYGTTGLVARRLGAGRDGDALAAGLDGLWLAAGLGALLAALTAVAARPACALLGAGPRVIDEAVVYLRIGAVGLPPMLLVLAASGVLRGLQDTRTPLRVATAGFTANIALNLGLVHGAHLGIAGSALGTVAAQTGMALALGVAVLHRARAAGARLAPHPAGVLRAALDGVPLLVRTLALRAALVATTWCAAGLGDAPLAAHHVVMAVFGFTTFALDALAIAGQALTGASLGAGDREGTRAATRVMLGWGLGAGAAMGAVLLALHRVLPAAFTPDPQVRAQAGAALVVLALAQPVAGLVFVLDGVLIGAGDGRALAVVQVAVLAAYLPLLLVVRARAGGTGGLVLLWWAFAGFLALRLAGLAVRARGERWMVTGGG